MCFILPPSSIKVVPILCFVDAGEGGGWCYVGWVVSGG